MPLLLLSKSQPLRCVVIWFLVRNERPWHLYCCDVTNGHWTNTYFFKGGFAVNVWLGKCRKQKKSAEVTTTPADFFTFLCIRNVCHAKAWQTQTAPFSRPFGTAEKEAQNLHSPQLFPRSAARDTAHEVLCRKGHRQASPRRAATCSAMVGTSHFPVRIASRMTSGEAGTLLMRTPAARETALRIAGVIGTVATSLTPFAP